MPASPGYGSEWKTVKGPNGSNVRIYTRCCDWCHQSYEGRGARFCGKKCSALWGRSTKDYSNASFPRGKDNPIFNRVQNFFESSLEKRVRCVLDELNIGYVHPYWANAPGWKQKQYDFFIPEFNLLIEVDGEYWHSLQENIQNDHYKNDLAKFLDKKLIRFPERNLTEDAIKSALADFRRKSKR